jgi:hypothetical protein
MGFEDFLDMMSVMGESAPAQVADHIAACQNSLAAKVASFLPGCQLFKPKQLEAWQSML